MCFTKPRRRVSAIMELNIFIAAPGEAACRAMRRDLSQIIYRTDLEKVSFLLCQTPRAALEMPLSHWLGLHLAFVDIACQEARKIGQRLYQKNPSCRLIYYGQGGTELLPLLPSRPVWYWDVEGASSLDELLFEQISSFRSDPGFFFYSDRFRSLAVPYSAILCFYSQKRMVYIHTTQGELGPIPKPLDHLEPILAQGRFLRVHQSFLVNRNHLSSLDRSAHVLRLADGYEVPVSRTYYSRAAAAFCQNSSLGDQNNMIADKIPLNILYSQQEEGAQ